MGGGDNFKILWGDTAVMRRDIELMGDPQSPTRENPVGGCSVHWEDIMIHVGDIMSTSEDFQYIREIRRAYRGGYHEYIGGIS